MTREKFNIVRDGELTVTCLKELVGEPISKKLVECIVENDIIGAYSTVFRSKRGDLLCWIWECCKNGEITQQECADLFEILLDHVFISAYAREIFQKALDEWDPSDTFIFDLIPTDVLGPDEINDMLKPARRPSKLRQLDLHSLQRHLELCCFLANRGYHVKASLVYKILHVWEGVKLRRWDAPPEVFELIRCQMAKFPERLRNEIYCALLGRFPILVYSPEKGRRMIGWYHILADCPCLLDVYHRLTPYSAITCQHMLVEDEGQLPRIDLKRSLAILYRSLQRGIAKGDIKNQEDTEEILRSILDPETLTTFPQLFHADKNQSVQS